MSKIVTAPANASLSVSSTPEQLTTSNIEVWSCIVTAVKSNTVTVYVGDLSVDENAEVGTPLEPGESISFDGTQLGAGYEPFNLNEIFFDASTDSQELSYTYMKSRRTPRTVS